MTEKEYLNRLVHDIAKSARYFKDCDSILRHRKRCISKELHEKGIKILDDVIMSLCERLNDE